MVDFVLGGVALFSILLHDVTLFCYGCLSHAAALQTGGVVAGWRWIKDDMKRTAGFDCQYEWSFFLSLFAAGMFIPIVALALAAHKVEVQAFVNHFYQIKDFTDGDGQGL